MSGGGRDQGSARAPEYGRAPDGPGGDRVPPEVAPLLEGFAVRIRAPVAWGEMDAFGHVNNVVFFRWFESARIAYLGAIGFQGGGPGGGVGPILASTHCRFRVPLAYPDAVWAAARATEVGEDRFTMEYRVVSEGRGAVAAEGGGVVVSFDYERGRKAPLPAEVRRRIREVERAAGAGEPNPSQGGGP